MIKIITPIKHEKLVISLLDENKEIKKEKERIEKISDDIIDFLINKNGIVYLKYPRKMFYITEIRKILFALDKKISKYDTEEKDAKVKVFSGLPYNKKIKDDIYFFDPNQEKFNMLPLYLGFDYKNDYNRDTSLLFDFSYLDMKKENKEPVIVRLKAKKNEEVKNAGQIASYIIRSLVRDRDDVIISYVLNEENPSIEEKLYQTLIILERMSKESIEAICGGYNNVPKEFQYYHKIKIFMELPILEKEEINTLTKDNKGNYIATNTDEEGKTDNVIKIKLHLSYLN